MIQVTDTVNLTIIPQTLALNEKFQELRSEIAMLVQLSQSCGCFKCSATVITDVVQLE